MIRPEPEKQTKEEQIRHYLQRKDIRQEIEGNMERVRSQVKVTIGKAVELFDNKNKEAQLRYWGQIGLLHPEITNARHRLYSLGELEKLAIIGVLVRKFAPSDIPSNIDEIWYSLNQEDISASQSNNISYNNERNFLTINQSIEQGSKALFWRYYIPRALRIALTLIQEDIQNTPAGLVLPLQENMANSSLTIRDLSQLGLSLVGWLDENEFSGTHAMLTTAPAFEYPTDYTLFPLTAIEDEKLQEAAKDAIYILLYRRDKRRGLTLNALHIETIHLLLYPLYKNRSLLPQYFGEEKRDSLRPVIKVEGDENYANVILNDFAEMIVQFGNRANSATNEPRWLFCCILLAKDRSLPLQQQTLLVQAQSKDGPYQVGKTQVFPMLNANSLSLRAFQSSRVTYRAVNVPREQVIAYQDMEATTHSAIGVPIGGENGMPLGAIYIASHQLDAFSKNDQRVLRFFARMIEELLRTYEARRLAVQNLKELIRNPTIVDQSFVDFASENDFIRDVEAVLQSLYDHHIGGEIYNRNGEVIKEIEQLDNDVLSCIAIDIDQHSVLATKYGDVLVHNLCREVGLRIRNILYSTGLITQDAVLYHICADRFYIVFKETPFQQVKARAKRLKNELDGAYKVSILYSALDQTISAGNLQEVKITVRLAVSSYTLDTLVRNLKHNSTSNAVSAFRIIIEKTLEERLKKGMSLGGNVIISWNAQLRRAEPLSLIE